MIALTDLSGPQAPDIRTRHGYPTLTKGTQNDDLS